MPDRAVRPTTRLVWALLLAAANVAPAMAQADTSIVTRRGWSLRRTMDAFADGPSVDFFPQRGDWTWVVAFEQADGSIRVGRHRFSAGDLAKALEPGAPLCDSFSFGESAVMGTPISSWIDHQDEQWRRVGPTRFVPPGAPASSPLFVEWRREDGRWVIDTLGEWRGHVPHLAGREVNEVVLERPLAPLRLPLSDTARVAVGAPWFGDGPITVASHWFVRYGLPRQLNEGDLVRYGSLHGVAIYAEPHIEGFRQVVYIPVDRAGIFQPYQNMSGNGCEH